MQKDSLEISFNFQQSIMNSGGMQASLCEQSKTFQRQTKVQAHLEEFELWSTQAQRCRLAPGRAQPLLPHEVC